MREICVIQNSKDVVMNYFNSKMM